MIDEVLDIVDKNDAVIGKKTRNDIYRDNMSNFRVVNAFIQNDKGQLCIPRRSTNKRIFPLCLDTSMGGHVESGESYEDAFKRETMEELNIDITKITYKKIASFTPHQHNMSAFMQVFLIYSNQTPQYNNNDFIEFFWLKPHEIINLIKDGEPSKGDLPKIIQNLCVDNLLSLTKK